MGSPSSQLIALWVKNSLVGVEWIRLDEACSRALNIELGPKGVTRVADIVAENVSYVAEHLREELSACEQDGVPPEFEIDAEFLPYIRLTDIQTKDLLAKLRRVDPFDFESVCAEILRKLGAQAEVTKRSNDDGVDFYAIDFDFVPDGINTPQACRAAVIGQAKRFTEGNAVKETDIRAFVGGALKVKNELSSTRKIFPLSPVVYAFWTTSDFTPSAKQFARDMGVWYLSGRALARYVYELRLESFVDDLLANLVDTDMNRISKSSSPRAH
jgi:hypothetical protein